MKDLKITILLSDNPASGLAVWYSAQSHLDYLKQAGARITVMLPEKYEGDLDKFWITGFRADDVVTYNNLPQLIIKLRKRTGEKHFCLGWKEVLLIRTFLIFKQKQTFYWYQGIVPEEDFLRRKSKFRKFLLQTLEISALKRTDKVVLVSSYMKEYIERTRKLALPNHIIIPCASNLEYIPSIRKKNSFIYIGGLTEWQRIDRILKMFSLIAKELTESTLHLITYDTNKAMTLVKKHVPEQLSKSVITRTIMDRDAVAALLSTMEYGFLIRDDDPVNNVSSPIKLAEYLSCGVNVIVSKAISSYAEVLEKEACGIAVDKNSDIQKILRHSYNESAALDTYRKLFDKKKMIEEYKNFILK